MTSGDNFVEIASDAIVLWEKAYMKYVNTEKENISFPDFLSSGELITKYINIVNRENKLKRIINEKRRKKN